MPSCMFQLPSNVGLMDTSGQATRNKLYRFHIAKENVSGCRKRLDFGHAFSSGLYGLKPGQQITVARRNERERNRVKLINMTFATLRDHLPFEQETSKSKKMSKVDTLKAAINYIKHLQEIVDGQEGMNAEINAGMNAVLSEACGMDNVDLDISTCTDTSPEKSPQEPSAESEASFDGLSVEEDELLDFNSWF